MAVAREVATTVIRVLIVDDEPAMLRALGAHLCARGYQVDLADTGETAISRGTTNSYDLAIVDLGLPGIGGLEVVHGLRAHSSMPIVVLSAWHDEARKIHALDAGADDYVTKPFGMGELLARLRAVLRRDRPVHLAPPVVETVDFRIDVAAKRATKADGTEIALTPTQWHLVEILVRNPDHLVSQRELLEEVWGPSYLNQTNYLRQFMAQVRRKFEPDPAHPRYFLTATGHGRTVRPVARDGHRVVDHCVSRSSARFSSSTFTAGSPRMPSARPSVYLSTSARTRASES